MRVTAAATRAPRRRTPGFATGTEDGEPTPETGSGKNHAKARGTNVRAVTRARNPLIRPHAPSETRQFGHFWAGTGVPQTRGATCDLDESRIFADQRAGLGGSSRTKAPLAWFFPLPVSAPQYGGIGSTCDVESH